MDAMLKDGVRWAITRGGVEARDLERMKENGRVSDADPA
jgi:RNA-splicing ligase RtcB